MADAKGKKDPEPAAAPAAPESTRMGIRLVPVGDSDQPVVANYTALNVAPGMVFIDFGFLEPAMLSALPRVAKGGGKLPERINGKLAVRVALGPDTLSNLKKQIDALAAASRRATEKK
jgi:hypothetical protein